MALKVVLGFVTVFITLAIGFQQMRTNQEIKERALKGRVALAIEDAKAKNQKEVTLRAPIPLYAQVSDLDDALSHYTTLIAEPVSTFSLVNADSKEIETWYKLKVLDFLSQPQTQQCQSCAPLFNLPQQLQPVAEDEIVIPRYAGSITSDGVRVTTYDPFFPDFKLNQPYFFFVSFDPSTRIASLPLGPMGTLVIQSDGQLGTVSSRYHKLNDELKVRYHDIDEAKKQLRFRRFPG